MHKVETHRIRFTVGGNRIDYKGKVSTPTANLETIKLLLNSTVSTPNAKMLTADIENFYLGTPMDRYEYMRIPQKTFRPTSWSSTTSLRLSTMAMSSLKFEKACMAFRKPAS